MPIDDVGAELSPPAETEPWTVGSLWRSLSDVELSDELVDWPPDVFALTDVVLEHSEAYRFAVSPPKDRRWPPSDAGDWNTAIAATARDWRARAGTDRAPPQLVAEEWTVVRRHIATPLHELSEGKTWRLCEALLTLHALADESCSGTGVAVVLDGVGLRFRGRAHERLARTGSLSRLSRWRLRVLPRVHNTPGGISFRSLSRYLCVRGPSVEATWNRIPLRPRATSTSALLSNILLLPWPLRVDEADFRPVGAVQRAEQEPYGFFEFAPSETFDLRLVDRALVTARSLAGSADVVVLPESALEPGELDELESLLDRHRVTMLVAGIREAPDPQGYPSGNWLHLAIRFGGRWWHFRQNKHHRWFLDEDQIRRYNLAGALAPTVRWWEAMEVPHRAVQLLELGEGITLVSIVCEDLARLDEVSDLLRAIGPTLVVAILLDGPQLPSRWTARYASVLADDPGSAVLTLSSFGFVQRSRPGGRAPSSVVSFWKDPVRGFREIPLEPGAHGVLLSITIGRTTRRSADGRFPVANAAELLVRDVHPIFAPERPDDTVHPPVAPVGVDLDRAEMAALTAAELTILTSWAEMLAEALSSAPDRIAAVLEDARPGAPWRAGAGLEEPSPELAAALWDLKEIVDSTAGERGPTVASVVAAIESREDPERRRRGTTRRLVGTVLLSALDWQRSAG